MGLLDRPSRRAVAVASAAVILIVPAGCVTAPSAGDGGTVGVPSTTDTPGRSAASTSPSGELGVGVVREITPLEYGEVIVACMAEFGFAAEPIDGGEGVRYEPVPPEQNEALEAAYDECRARYPTAEVYTRPLTEEQLGILYDYWIEERFPCLAAEGITGFDPPSRQTFISSPDYQRWSPEDLLASRAGSGERLHELLELCPRRPPLEELYGEQPTG